MKRKVDEVESVLSDPESPLGEDEFAPSPDSAVMLSKDDLFQSISDKISENCDSDVPERSPDSGLCGGSGGEFLDDFSSLAKNDPTVGVNKRNE